MELTIYPYKTEGKIWAFDHEHLNTVGEGLLNGTELVLDRYFWNLNKQSPVTGDRLKITVSTTDYVCPEDGSNPAITTLDLLSSDSYGSFYEDFETGMDVWLCPWLQGYFGEVPKRLFITVETYNIVH